MNLQLIFTNDEIKEKYGLPTFATPGSAGIDLRYAGPELAIQDGEVYVAPTGVKIFLQDPNYGAFLYPRSGLAVKKRLTLINKVGVIDSDYQNEIKVALHNESDKVVFIEFGDKIAQLVFHPIARPTFTVVDKFSAETERGQGGFGSTGDK